MDMIIVSAGKIGLQIELEPNALKKIINAEFIDLIKEITQIAWRTQAIAEELPSGTTLPILND